jgi:hypothetical protein
MAVMRTGLILFLSIAVAATALADEEGGVATTVEGGSQDVKSGGQTMGEGFRAFGRGVKKMFTGERSKEEFQETKKVGTGAAELGKGVGGRGIGEEIKDGFTGEPGNEKTAPE